MYVTPLTSLEEVLYYIAWVVVVCVVSTVIFNWREVMKK